MAIWSLEVKVINKDSPHWARSTYQGNLLIRAENEDHARTLADLKYGLATTSEKMGPDTLYNPWGQKELVNCEPVADSEYPKSGPDDGIIELRKLKPSN